jgi:DNA-binding XRE family transcriptional regulator
MNQSKLAKLLKVSTSTLSRKMKKRSEFTLIEAKVIADFFNKTIDEIFFYESD